jgi:hypothetical protein
MDGMTPHEHINHVDGTAQPITATANDQGKFLLELPVNPDNPLFLKSLEGFVECSRPDKPNLAVSMYLNTAGMRANERIRLGQKMKVDPNSTVNREMFENFRTADSTADLVGIQARFADDIQGLATKSPVAKSEEKTNTCPRTDIVTDKDALNISLKNARNDPMDPLAPPIPPQPRAALAAYIASQLFLASLKVEDVLAQAALLIVADPTACDVLDELQGQGPNQFVPALMEYFKNDQITANNLVNLGLQGDGAIVIAPGSC